MVDKKMEFIDNVKRCKIKEVINKQIQKGFEFVSFCQYNNLYDEEIGILFMLEKKKK